MSVCFTNFIAESIKSNSIFNLSDSGNRDDCYFPYWLLREKLIAHGIELNTSDINYQRPILFEIDMDVKKGRSTTPSYVLLWETPQILAINRSSKHLSRYRKIFTWDDSLIDGDRFIKLNMPNKQNTFSMLGFNGRNKLCCLIAGNKCVQRYDSLELYSKRVETIRWFELHAKNDFDLYGIGWNCPPARIGYIGKLFARLVKPLYGRLNMHPFPSYKGPVHSKNETLTRYKFAICYENVSGLTGYITEKIFDCFFAGCVPVYWGAANINDYVPQDCFIDRRKFSNHESLHHYLTSMTEAEYILYQKAIQKFLASEAAKLFYAEHFATTVVNTILADLEIIT